MKMKCPTGGRREMGGNKENEKAWLPMTHKP
jgi:hypothetical protein